MFAKQRSWWSILFALGLLMSSSAVVTAQASPPQLFIPLITGGGDSALNVSSNAAPLPVVTRREGAPVLPPQGRAFGTTYSELSAKWWQWAYALPADENHPLEPIEADGEVDCALGQSGRVWFLGGTYTTGPDPDAPPGIPTAIVGEADRQCTVPTGKAIFFPILNGDADNFFEDIPLSEDELRALANEQMDAVDPNDLSVTIDGVTVGNLQDYRVESPLFTLGPLPDPNLPNAPAGTTSIAVADGYFILLPPLSAGEHEIEFAGQVVLTDEEGNPSFSFRLEIRYELTVH